MEERETRRGRATVGECERRAPKLRRLGGRVRRGGVGDIVGRRPPLSDEVDARARAKRREALELPPVPRSHVAVVGGVALDARRVALEPPA